MRIDEYRDISARVDQVHELMMSEDFQREKAHALRALDFQMSTNGHTVTTRRKQETVGMPEFVKALVTPTITVIETEEWQPEQSPEQRTGSFDLDVEGAPVSLRGAVEIVATDAGCRLRFSGDLTSTVPLFRQRIEEASSHSVLETIRIEFDLLERRTKARVVAEQ